MAHRRSAVPAGAAEAGPLAVDEGQLGRTRRLWPMLVITFLGNIPLIAAMVSIAPIAQPVGSETATIGAFYGTSGLAAFLTSVLIAPLLDRVSRRTVIVGGLVVLTLANALLSVGVLPLVLAFFLLGGAAMTVINPALQAASSDGVSVRQGSWAATLVIATQILGQGMAGLALVLPAALWSWQGAYVLLSVLTGLLALGAWRYIADTRPTVPRRPGYLATFQQVATAPGAVLLLTCIALRATGHTGAYAGYLGPYFMQVLRSDLAVASAIFFAAGIGIFGCSLLAGRFMQSATGRRNRHTPGQALVAGITVLLVSATATYLVTDLFVASSLIVLMAVGHGVSQAAIMALIVERYPTLRGAMLSLNSASVQVGIFVGATFGAMALWVADYLGVAMVVGGLLAGALAVAWLVARRPMVTVTGGT